MDSPKFLHHTDTLVKYDTSLCILLRSDEAASLACVTKAILAIGVREHLHVYQILYSLTFPPFLSCSFLIFMLCVPDILLF